MLCLYGSICNETTGFCDECPQGYRNDEVLFIGNQNCGVSETAMYVIYILCAIFSLSTSFWSFQTARKRKKSVMRDLLILNTVWNFLIVCLLVSHYLEGFKNGVVSVILYTTILMMVNTQVLVLMYLIERYMGVLCNFSSPQTVYRFMRSWYIFWMLCKFISGLVVLIAAGIDNVRMYNIAQMCLIGSVLLEVSLNVLRAMYTNSRFINEISRLHGVGGELRLNPNPILLEFAEQVKGVK